MPKIISVASTYATDVILDDKQNVLSVQPGGPLYFIERVFKEQKVENRLYLRLLYFLLNVLISFY